MYIYMLFRVFVGAPRGPKGGPLQGPREGSLQGPREGPLQGPREGPLGPGLGGPTRAQTRGARGVGDVDHEPASHSVRC